MIRPVCRRKYFQKRKAAEDCMKIRSECIGSLWTGLSTVRQKAEVEKTEEKVYVANDMTHPDT